MTTEANDKEQQELYAAYFELHEALRNAYWATSDEKTGNIITGLADTCYEILTKLNQDGIKKRTTEYNDLNELVKKSNDRLKNIKDEIDNIIHSVSIATKVVDGIEKALVLAAKFFI